MNQTPSGNQADVDASDREFLAQLTRARRHLGIGLGILLAGVTAAVVFHRPEAWGDGEVAQLVQRFAWAGALLGVILMYRANGSYGEARGYFRGRLGYDFEQKLLDLLAKAVSS